MNENTWVKYIFGLQTMRSQKFIILNSCMIHVSLGVIKNIWKKSYYRYLNSKPSIKSGNNAVAIIFHHFLLMFLYSLIISPSWKVPGIHYDFVSPLKPQCLSAGLPFSGWEASLIEICFFPTLHQNVSVSNIIPIRMCIHLRFSLKNKNKKNNQEAKF